MNVAGPGRALLAVFLLASLWAGSARAECLEGGVSGAAVARIDGALLQLLPPIIVAQIPTRFEVPETTFPVFDCDPPFDPTQITPLHTVVEVEITQLSAAFVEGALQIDAAANLRVRGAIDMQVCALADAVCDAELDSQGVAVRATVVPRLQDCELSYEIAELEFLADPAATTSALRDCTYENLWEFVEEWFADALLELVADELEAWVSEEIPPLLQSLTADLLAGDFRVYGFVIRAAVEELDIRPGAASVTFAADVRPEGEPAACVPTGAGLPEEDGPAAAEPSSRSMVSLAVSEAMVRRAVRSAWLTGLFCYDSRDYDFDLSSPLDFMAPGVQVEGQVSAGAPPQVVLDGSASGGVEVQADDVRVEVTLQVPGHAATTMSATTGVALRGDVAIDPAYQSLVVDLREAGATGALVTAPGTSLAFSGQTLESILRTGLLPAYAGIIRSIPLLSNLFVTAPVAVRIASVRVAGQQVEADAELWPMVAGDDTPPETVVAVYPPDPAWVDVPVEMASHDDHTPSRFLQHVVLVDGEPWDEDPLSGERLYIWELLHGPHTMSIQAVDLNGNADPTPEVFEIFVDDLPPEVSFVDPPGGIIRESSVSLDFRASDDTTPAATLGLRYTLGILQDGNQPDLPVAEGALRLGDTLHLGDLPEDVILRVTVLATDEAGNEGEGSVAFVSNPTPTLGCSAVGGRQPPRAALLGLLLCLLLAPRAWRRSGS